MITFREIICFRNQNNFFLSQYEDTGVFGSSNETHIDDVSCQEGQEFPSCDHTIWGSHNCQPSEDVGVACLNSTGN